MSCPDWRSLSPDAPAAWNDAVVHFDGGCPHCRRDALKADPTLVFRSLRSAPAPAASSSDVESMRQAVAAMRAASRVDSIESRSRLHRSFHNTAWKRWAVAAGLVLAALSIPADNVRKHPALQSRPAAALLGAVMPAALVGGMGGGGEIDLPTVEGVNHPDARVYHMDGEGLSVVMIVDESLDV